MKRHLMFLLIFVSGITHAQTTEDQATWDYPVKPGTEEWRNLKTVKEMVEVCQIPQDILTNLSTKELAEICVNYPLFENYSAMNNERKGIRYTIDEFNGLTELGNREDGASELIKVYKGFPVMSETQQKSPKYTYLSIKLPFLELLLADDVFIKQLDDRLSVELEKAVSDRYTSKLENNHIYGIWNIKRTFLLGAVVMKHRNKFVDMPDKQDILNRFIENYERADPVLVAEISKIISEI